MKFVALFAALAAAIPAAIGLTINTPGNVVECQPTQLAWSGGTAPYYLSLLPAGQTTASPIKTFPTQNGNSYTWNVDIAAGTSFTIELKDSTGTQAFSDIVSIQGGTDTSCLNGSGSSSASNGAATTGSSSGPATSAAAGGSSTAGASTKASSGSATSAAASSSSTSSSSSSGAGRLTVSAFGIAGLMGLVGAALF